MDDNLNKDSSLSKSKKSKQYYMLRQYPNMKILDMDLNKHMYVLNRRNTIFTNMTIEKIYNATSNILSLTCEALDMGGEDVQLYKKNAKLKTLGMETEKLFTGDNIFDIFDFGSKFIQNNLEHTTTTNNFKANIKVLSKLIPINDILQIIQHNFVFLTQNNTKKFKKLLNESKTESELKQAIQALVNTRDSVASDKSTGSSLSGEKSNSKLIRKQIVLNNFALNLDALKDMDFEINSGLMPKVQKIAKQTNKEEPIDYYTIFDDDDDPLLDRLERDIKEDGDELDLAENEEETLPEKKTENSAEDIYNVANNLTFELQAIADYYLLNEADWLAMDKYNNTAVSTILSLNKTNVKNCLNTVKSNIAQILSNPTFDEYSIYFETELPNVIECLDSIIAQKQESKQFLFELVKESYKAQKLEPNQNPNIIQKAIQESTKNLKMGKMLNDEGLLKLMTAQRNYLQMKLKQTQAINSPYNKQLQDKKSCTDALKEYAEIDEKISGLTQLKGVVEDFYSKITAKQQTQQQRAEEVLKIQQQKDASRIEKIKAELKDIEIKISNLSFKIDSDRTAITKIEKQFGDSNPTFHKTAYKKKQIEKRTSELDKLQSRKEELEQALKNLQPDTKKSLV